MRDQTDRNLEEAGHHCTALAGTSQAAHPAVNETRRIIIIAVVISSWTPFDDDEEYVL